MDEFITNTKELLERLTASIAQIKYLNELGDTTEAAGDNGVLFTINVTDKNNYLINFGDAQYECNEEFLNGLEGIFPPKED